MTPKIGLEIHIELATETKMFCGCRNDPRERHPNVNVCPVCLGHPGTLPVPNKQALESVVKLGLALGGEVAETSHFDRKSYFYPDLPKGYQISQSGEPLVRGGELNGIRIHHIHVEEDAGRLAHRDGKSLVDFNRAGVPLAELVTEPDIRSAADAAAFGRELQRIVRYLGIGNADMEEGELRIEVNVSVGGGNKVELKNLNSFKAVEGAAAYETARQSALFEAGKRVRQETRGWDDAKRETYPQRSKESAHDYRYFPDPDLPPLVLADILDVGVLRAALPELPQAKRERFTREYGLSGSEAALITEALAEADFFEAAASELRSIDAHLPYGALYHYLVSDLRGLLSARGGSSSGGEEWGLSIGDMRITPASFAALVAKVEQGTFTSRIAKDILVKMFETGDDPAAIAEAEHIAVIGSDGLADAAKEVVAENAPAVADYQNGKASALQFLVGQLMAKTRGQAEPEAARDVLRDLLER